MKRYSTISFLVLVTALALVALVPGVASAAPEVRLTAPSAGASVAGNVAVSAAATLPAEGRHASLTVDGPAVAEVTATAVSGGAYTVSATWDSKTVANGAHVVGIKVTDASGTAEATVSVNVENPSVAVNVSPSTISPNRDGSADSAVASYTLGTESVVTAVVKNRSGSVVATLVAGETKAAGAQSVTWDGLLAGKPDLANGTYTIEISAAHLGQTATAHTSVVMLVKKATAKVWPSMAAFSPNGDGSADTVRISVRLGKWAYLSVGIYSTSGRLVKTLQKKALKAAKSGKGYRYVWNGRTNTGAKATPGMYAIKAIARNQAGGAVYTNTVRIRGERTLLLIRSLIRIYWLEGKDPLPGPKWADWRLNGQKVAVFPIAVGMPGWTTPAGHTFVEKKTKWPTWYPPSWAGLSSPVGPGRSNPLGPRALYLSPRGYDDGIRIHGTNNPSSIGTRASHGCIRLYPKDVIWLYDQVPVGTKVWISQKLPKGYPLVGPKKPSPGNSRRWY